MSEPYRPRRPTRRETEQDEEHRQYKRKRLSKKKEQERAYRDKRSSKMNYSELDGVGYQDFTLGPSGQVKTRTQLDRRAYLDYRSRIGIEERPFLDSVPSLAECCLDLVAENYGEPEQLAALDSIHHSAHVKPIFDRVKRIRKDHDSLLPFELWNDFALEFGLDLPNRFKTYKGLVVSGDAQELELIKESNQSAIRRSLNRQNPASFFAPPAFFLATLDLSNDRTFTDSDVYKLRNPLSNFLAVLKLDGTSITDGGIAWISRATTDPDAYKHLEVLSLRGLTRVTNDGVAKLTKLSNLRMLDLRNTGCTHQVSIRLNESLGRSSSPFVPARARTDLRQQTLIEFEVFGGSLSPSRILSSLHRLGEIHHAPLDSLESIIRAPLVKQLSLHLTAMNRRPAPSSSRSSAAEGGGGGGEKTCEQLYQEQLSLSGFSGSSLATHHAAFGTLTSTKSLARKLIEDDARAVGERGAAFRTNGGAGDSIALGEYVGSDRVGGRTSLYQVGLRKLSTSDQGDKTRGEREPFSDTEDEMDQETEMRRQEEEELKQWEEETNKGFSFYAGRKPVPRPERVIVAAEQSKMTLLRHLPFVPPYERRAAPTVVPEEAEERVRVGGPISQESRTREGGTLLKKRRRVDATSLSSSPSLNRLSGSSSTSPLIATTARPTLPPSSSSSRSSLPTSNPFSKKPKPSSSARTDRKNIIQCAPALTKRSNLSAFRR